MASQFINIPELIDKTSRQAINQTVSGTLYLATTYYVRVQSLSTTVPIAISLDSTNAFVGQEIIFRLLDTISVGDVTITIANGGLVSDGKGGSGSSRTLKSSFGPKFLILRYVGSNIYEDISSQLGISQGVVQNLTMTSWDTTVYNQLYAPLTLPYNLYILKIYTTASGQNPVTSYWYVHIDAMQNSNSVASDLTAFHTMQASGNPQTAVIKVRVRKPQNAFEVGAMGIEASLVNSAYSGGAMVYSLTQVI